MKQAWSGTRDALGLWVLFLPVTVFGSVWKFSRALVDLLSSTRPFPYLLAKRTSTVLGISTIKICFISFCEVLGIEPRPPHQIDSSCFHGLKTVFS